MNNPLTDCPGCGAPAGVRCKAISTECRSRSGHTTQARINAATYGTVPLLTLDSATRKQQPIATGVLDYFPLALAAVARLSKIGNDKHNPGEPLHWSRDKSDDHADCILRHMVDRGTVDTDGELHDAKVAWRALAQLQIAEEKRRDEK